MSNSKKRKLHAILFADMNGVQFWIGIMNAPIYGIKLRNNPIYHRIKKDYPPFAKAVEELKLPAIVPFEAPLKN